MNEQNKNVINNEYDYSNVVASEEWLLHLVEYCDKIYKQFIQLVNKDEEQNKQFKPEYKNYNYKKSYETNFSIYIREKSYNNIMCNDFETFKSAALDGNLKNVSSLDIQLNLSFKRGKEGNLEEHENSFSILFRPYEITFARKSMKNDISMDNIENGINGILKKFPVVNTIFCSK